MTHKIIHKRSNPTKKKLLTFVEIVEHWKPHWVIITNAQHKIYYAYVFLNCWNFRKLTWNCWIAFSIINKCSIKCRTLVVHIVVKHIFKYIIKGTQTYGILYSSHVINNIALVGLCDVEWVQEADSCKKYHMLCLIA